RTDSICGEFPREVWNQKKQCGVYSKSEGVHWMKKAGKISLFALALTFAVIPLLSQTAPSGKPSFEVISIKPSAPNLGIRGGGPRGDRYTMSGASLRMLLQQGYSKANSMPLFG